jgi:hypothetical protein
MKLRIAFCAVALVLSASAFAQQKGNPAAAAAREACAADIQSMCSDKKGGQVFACLRGNSDKLSAGCKDAMAKLPPPAAPAPKQ